VVRSVIDRSCTPSKHTIHTCRQTLSAFTDNQKVPSSKHDDRIIKIELAILKVEEPTRIICSPHCPAPPHTRTCTHHAHPNLKIDMFHGLLSRLREIIHILWCASVPRREGCWRQFSALSQIKNRHSHQERTLPNLERGCPPHPQHTRTKPLY